MARAAGAWTAIARPLGGSAILSGNSHLDGDPDTIHRAGRAGGFPVAHPRRIEAKGERAGASVTGLALGSCPGPAPASRCSTCFANAGRKQTPAARVREATAHIALDRRNSARFLMLLATRHPAKLGGHRKPRSKFGLTVRPLWSKRGLQGLKTPMFVRATSLIVLFGAIVLGSTALAEPTGATPPQTREPNDFPIASEVRVAGDDSQTRMVVDLSQKMEVRAFTLAHPYRVVIDLPQVTFNVPVGTGETGRGLIKAFRFGLVMQGGSRIVIDLARPARIDKAFVLDAGNDQPARLVLDLAATDRESFLRTVTLDNRAAPTRKAAAHPEQKPNGDQRPLVVIDPGHGGIDNGTKAATGELEKTIVLEFSLLLRDKIEKAGKYRVAMPRTDDTFVAPGDRVALARSRQAALFISIHA